MMATYGTSFLKHLPASKCSRKPCKLPPAIIMIREAIGALRDNKLYQQDFRLFRKKNSSWRRAISKYLFSLLQFSTYTLLVKNQPAKNRPFPDIENRVKIWKI